MVKAKVEQALSFPSAFRPVHDLDRVEDWEGVAVRFRGVPAIVRGGVKERGEIRLFVITGNRSLWVAVKDVEVMTVTSEPTIVDDGIDHSQEIIADEEPEGGWVTAPTLLTGEIQSIVLCKYSGERPLESVAPGTLQCQSRVLRRHKDEDCFVFFHSAAALLAGTVEVSGEDLLIAEETVRTGDEITYKNPIT